MAHGRPDGCAGAARVSQVVSGRATEGETATVLNLPVNQLALLGSCPAIAVVGGPA